MRVRTVKTALWALQEAVYKRLNEDPIVSSMVTKVYDEVKKGARTPYIQIGDDTVNPYDSKTFVGEDLTLTLHVWSGGPGKTEAKKIMNTVLEAMTATPLTLATGFELEGLEREFLEVFNDGQAYHGVCRFRVYIKQN